MFDAYTILLFKIFIWEFGIINILIICFGIMLLIIYIRKRIITYMDKKMINRIQNRINNSNIDDLDEM